MPGWPALLEGETVPALTGDTPRATCASAVPRPPAGLSGFGPCQHALPNGVQVQADRAFKSIRRRYVGWAARQLGECARCHVKRCTVQPIIHGRRTDRNAKSGQRRDPRVNANIKHEQSAGFGNAGIAQEANTAKAENVEGASMPGRPAPRGRRQEIEQPIISQITNVGRAQAGQLGGGGGAEAWRGNVVHAASISMGMLSCGVSRRKLVMTVAELTLCIPMGYKLRDVSYQETLLLFPIRIHNFRLDIIRELCILFSAVPEAPPYQGRPHRMENVSVLVDAILAADRTYNDPEVSEEAVGAAVDTWGKAMARFAQVPGVTPEIRMGKARALRTALIHRRDGSAPTIEGDQGLAESLLRDMLAAAA